MVTLVTSDVLAPSKKKHSVMASSVHTSPNGQDGDNVVYNVTVESVSEPENVLVENKEILVVKESCLKVKFVTINNARNGHYGLTGPHVHDHVVVDTEHVLEHVTTDSCTMLDVTVMHQKVNHVMSRTAHDGDHGLNGVYVALNVDVVS